MVPPALASILELGKGPRALACPLTNQERASGQVSCPGSRFVVADLPTFWAVCCLSLAAFGSLMHKSGFGLLPLPFPLWRARPGVSPWRGFSVAREQGDPATALGQWSLRPASAPKISKNISNLNFFSWPHVQKSASHQTFLSIIHHPGSRRLSGPHHIAP